MVFYFILSCKMIVSLKVKYKIVLHFSNTLTSSLFIYCVHSILVDKKPIL